MNKILNDDFIFLVLSIVAEIPWGKVATYGQIASLADKPKNARLIGKILKMADYYGTFPCHRVVNFNGRLAPFFEEQKKRLENENVTFIDDKHVDLKKHKWNIN